MLRTGESTSLQAEVKGIYKPPPFYPLLGDASISIAAFDELVERPRNQYTFVNVAGGPNEASRAELEEATAGFPDARVQTRQEWIDKEDAEFDDFLAMLYVLLALSVIISLFGMVNTLVLSVFERTRELGMLRAVGMTRRQTRRMIRHESVITALIGAALGLPLGIFLAVLVTRALERVRHPLLDPDRAARLPRRPRGDRRACSPRSRRRAARRSSTRSKRSITNRGAACSPRYD